MKKIEYIPILGGVIVFVFLMWYLPDLRQESYFVSYYTTTTTNGFFGQRVFVAKTLDVSTINRMKGLIEEETTNSVVTLISIQKLP